MTENNETIKEEEVLTCQDECVVEKSENDVPCEKVSDEEVEQESEMTEEQREAFVSDWNSRYAAKEGTMRLEKPTEDDIKAIAEEYGKRVEDYNNREFTIADATNSLRVAKFLKRWNEEDAEWEGNMWMGTVMLDGIMKAFIKECTDEEKPLVVNYGTLTYLYLAMRNVRGRGLKSAIHMQSMNDEFTAVLNTVGDIMTDYQEEGKKLQKLQERWRMAEAGFYVEPLPEDVIEDKADTEVPSEASAE